MICGKAVWILDYHIGNPPSISAKKVVASSRNSISILAKLPPSVAMADATLEVREHIQELVLC
jgi:hypothetical protein